MTHGPNSGGPYEGGLSGSFSDHNRQGAWSSEQGTNAYCWETGIMESHSMGDSRHQAPTMSPSWNSTTILNTGKTSGNGMYDSDLPNH